VDQPPPAESNWTSTAQRARGPLPQLPGPPTLSGRPAPQAQGSHRGRGNEIFETIRHAPAAPQDRQVGTAAGGSRGHARDRAGHGTELQREGTTSREGTEDSLEASPPDTPGAARDGVRQEADQLINNGMDDAMLDSVIIPALDNVRPVLKVETVPITILQC
jgi:hypothetical protein